MSQYNQVSFKAEGRFAALESLTKTTKNLLIVFHGQGQLAKYFIQKFKSLQDKGFTIIAPEGLHYYYLEGFSGRVGASWMTSENRLVAVDNYVTFLDALLKDVLKQSSPDVKIHLLGFSQGSATVSRWIAQSSFDFEQLILWGGALPPDLDEKLIVNRMEGKPFLQVIGKADPYINSEQVEEIKMLNKKYGLSHEYLFYEGGHDINGTELLKLFT